MEEPALDTGTALAGALLITLVLAVMHLLAPHMRRLPGLGEGATSSFAGGLAVAYVFLHLLPELVEGRERLGRLLEAAVEASPLVDLAVFAVALAGFTLYYGLERLARRARARPAPDEPAGNGGALFALHVASFSVYNAVITYTMPLRLREGIAFGVLFAIAMGLHFVLTDRGMEEHYPERFRRYGRLVLAGALVAGWTLAALFAPTSVVVVSALIAFLGGSVLLNVFKEELPSERDSHFGAFLTGLVLYGLLLGAVTLLSE